ncbi:molecular chaperone Hsp33 [Lysobacter sp. yr284]|uniref:Hsp33 family molecular chaperone HslO n=1 Tax=Lysobacter TaxID=68 RepID=UPI00089C2EEC|nr:Hsp33 family molecular chaperone HslO [Lysobacter sp. yr284]SDY72466.1 molecular chaperone Hsp33 [Lysobacter sp. yr284]
MTDPVSTDSHDRLTRFLIEAAGVRGVHVRLDRAWQQIREREQYPQAAAELLGEAAAAAALFTGHAKVDGRLSVQLRGEGALRTLFAECTAAGTLRGIVQLAEDGGEVSRDLRQLGANAVLAITIENPSAGGRDPIRYQGLVALESDSLAGAFEGYFRQSEQLPTRLLLAADGDRAAGLMLQKLPGDGGDEDGWTRAGALFDTLGQAELLDLPADALLHRLFNEDGVQLLGGKPLSFACSCSRERVEAMLVSLGREEAEAAVEASGGEAQIRCEFCGQSYRFSPDQVAGLFAAAAAELEAPQRVQ